MMTLHFCRESMMVGFSLKCIIFSEIINQQRKEKKVDDTASELVKKMQNL